MSKAAYPKQGVPTLKVTIAFHSNLNLNIDIGEHQKTTSENKYSQPLLCWIYTTTVLAYAQMAYSCSSLLHKI